MISADSNYLMLVFGFDMVQCDSELACSDGQGSSASLVSSVSQESSVLQDSSASQESSVSLELLKS